MALTKSDNRCQDMAIQDSNPSDSVRRIILRTGERVMFDACDSHLVRARRWRRSMPTQGRDLVYARSSSVKYPVFMHRLIMNSKKGELIDHIDGNGLNNCRSNLRVCSHAENIRNRKTHKNNKSGYKGVCRDKTRWRSRIAINGKVIPLGGYRTALEAAQAYNDAAPRFHGEFARLNIIPHTG